MDTIAEADENHKHINLSSKRNSKLNLLSADANITPSSNDKSLENKSLESSVVNVLVENQMKDGIKLFGRTEFMTSVIFDGGVENIGKIIQVEITSSNQNSLFGKIKENFNQKVA